jgi:hypothetical protein
VHANARLTPQGRMTMVCRIAAGRPVAHVAAEMQREQSRIRKGTRSEQTLTQRVTVPKSAQRATT